MVRERRWHKYRCLSIKLATCAWRAAGGKKTDLNGEEQSSDTYWQKLLNSQLSFIPFVDIWALFRGHVDPSAAKHSLPAVDLLFLSYFSHSFWKHPLGSTKQRFAAIALVADVAKLHCSHMAGRWISLAQVPPSSCSLGFLGTKLHHEHSPSDTSEWFGLSCHRPGNPRKAEMPQACSSSIFSQCNGCSMMGDTPVGHTAKHPGYDLNLNCWLSLSLQEENKLKPFPPF